MKEEEDGAWRGGMEKGKEGEGREGRGDVDILEDVVDAAATDCY